MVSSLWYDPRKRRWLAFAALAVVFLLVNLHRLSTAVLSEELTDAFRISASQLGALHASFFVVYALIQVPTGALADRYGPRHVGAAGAIVLSLGALGFTASGGYLGAFASRVLIGLGSGVIFISMLRFCANWYRIDEFATMTGIVGGIAGLGAIFATTPLALAVEAVGWRPAVAGLAGLGFVAAAGVLVFVRRTPADAGLEPIERVPDQPAVGWADTAAHLRTLVGDLEQWLIAMVKFATLGTILTVIGLWGVPYLVVVHGLSVTAASSYTLLGALGMLIGAPGVGWLSDRIGRRLLPMLVGFGVFWLAVTVVPLFGRPPLAVVAVAYFVIGFSLGFGMLSLAVIKERYPPGASGIATATVNASGFLGATLLPWVMGLALDRYRTGDVVAGVVVYTEFGYRVAFAIVSATVALGLLCALWLYLRDAGGPLDARQ